MRKQKRVDVIDGFRSGGLGNGLPGFSGSGFEIISSVGQRRTWSSKNFVTLNCNPRIGNSSATAKATKSSRGIGYNIRSISFVAPDVRKRRSVHHTAKSGGRVHRLRGSRQASGTLVLHRLSRQVGKDCLIEYPLSFVLTGVS